MARFNPYQNSQIADSISGIAKALIGSADTDAALARGRASDASAKSYLAQARERNANAGILESLSKAGEGLAGDPGFQGVAASLLGLDVYPDGEFGPLAQNQVRLGTDRMSNLARTILGTFGNADQMTSAFSNIGLGNQKMDAGNMILSGTPEEAARGALYNAPQGGEFQNPSFAATKLADTLANAITLKGMDNKTNRDIANIEAAADRYKSELQYGPEGSEVATATIKADTEKEWQNYKTDVGLESDQYQADKKLEAENYKTDTESDATNYKTDKEFELGEKQLADKTKTENKKITTEDETARLKISEDIKFEKWKVENETLEMVVEPGKQIVLSPKAGERLGIEPNDQGLYILDGGPKRDAVTIEVGDEDVYLTKDQADAIGIKPNADGIYMIPGKTKSKGKDNPEFGPSDSKQVRETAKQTMEDLGIDLDPRVQSGILTKLETEAAEKFQETNSISSATDYVVSKLQERFGDQIMVEIDNPGRFTGSTKALGFVMNRIEAIISTATGDGTAALTKAKTTLQRFGYNPTEISVILNSFR